METAIDPGQVILDEVAALEVERARIEARIASKTLEFHDLRRREAESTDNAVKRDLEVSFAADELALVLLQPTRVVQCRLAEARRVRNLLPTTWLAFCVGRIDSYRVSLIASAAAKLTDNHSLIDSTITSVTTPLPTPVHRPRPGCAGSWPGVNPTGLPNAPGMRRLAGSCGSIIRTTACRT